MITAGMLAPMLRMSNADIEAFLMVGLYGLDKAELRGKRERNNRRDECQYEMYGDDWEREGDE